MIEEKTAITEDLTDEQIMHRIQVHIEKHKHQLLAPFSIIGVKRLLALAKEGSYVLNNRKELLEKLDTTALKDITKANPTNCTGCCYTNGYCNCKGDN